MQSDKNSADGLSLIPVSIIALGSPQAPIERLIGLQSAIGRGVDWLANLSLPPRPTFTRPAWLRFHPTSQGDL